MGTSDSKEQGEGGFICRSSN